jgi:hypothetical protein
MKRRFSDQVVVRLAADDRRRLDELARVSQMTPSAVMRAMLRTARVAAPVVVFSSHDGDAAEVSETHGAAIPA